MSLIDKIRKQKKPAINTDKKTINPLTRASGVRTMMDWDGWMQSSKKLSNEQLWQAASKNPFLSKGYNKKARDIIYDWFIIDCPLDQKDVPETMEQTANDFIQEQKVQYTFNRMAYDGYWQGNGYFEYVTDMYKEPDSIDKETNAEIYGQLTGKLNNIAYIDPTTIINVSYDEYDEVEYYIQYVKGSKKMLHKSRIGHFAPYKKGNYPFGFSPSEIAYNLVTYDANNTQALAELVHIFSHPWMHLNTGNRSDKDLESGFDVLKKVAAGKNKVGMVTKEGQSFELQNPGTFDPSPILNDFYVRFSAILEMPQMLLIGEQKGKLTGSEVEMNDYYKSIQAIQTLHITPLVSRMFKLLFGDSWSYPINWNDLFTDEKHEAEIKSIQSKYTQELYEKGLIELHESRQLLREYDIAIPEGGDMDNPDYDNEEDEDMDAVDQLEGIIAAPVKEIDEPTGKNISIRKPTRKELDLFARRQRELGEEILKEQGGK